MGTPFHSHRLGGPRALFALVVTALCCAALALLGSASARGAQPGAAPGLTRAPAPAPLADLAARAPIRSCASLTEADLSAAVGSPTHITAASEVRDGKPAPYCDVAGYVAPQVKFEVRLPLQGWTQRFVQNGCGGTCGHVGIHSNNAADCPPIANGQVVLSSTDMGHDGNSAEFGDDPQLRIDFAYRGVHVTALATKALIRAYYGQAARYSYFQGCSDGGREALEEAERFPTDFNGILVGAPVMNFTTQNTILNGWAATRNTGADGHAILTADKLPVLHAAAVAQCDTSDGLKDGLISYPWKCGFDPVVTECKAGQAPATCLTPAQVQVARDIYAGARGANGEKLTIIGTMPGSELAWIGIWVPRAGSDDIHGARYANDAFGHLVFPHTPAHFSLADVTFDRALFDRVTQLHSLYDATNPDLRRFHAAGGRIILYHGLYDSGNPPFNTIAYYTGMERIMGESAVGQFARLYLFPGGYHCAGGEGPFDVELMNPLMAWVERGTAPGTLIAVHPVSSGGPGSANQGSIPLTGPRAAAVDRTRPVFPYPYTARYTGTGSIDDAKNFVRGPIERVPAEGLHWAGSKFYAGNDLTWCQDDKGQLVCREQP